jgi:hypothetical protein
VGATGQRHPPTFAPEEESDIIDRRPVLVAENWDDAYAPEPTEKSWVEES